MIPVYEIFGSTIQGEGPNAGARCIFLRVAGCDYKCSFCDSKYTWGMSDEVDMYGEDELADVIIHKCIESSTYHVVITGGNPCLYDFTKLTYRCYLSNIIVDIETQGSILPAWLKNVDTLVFSPKPPSSGQGDVYSNIESYIRKLKTDQNIAIKIPIFTEEDIDFARKYGKLIDSLIDEKILDRKFLKLYLSVGNTDVDTTESIRDRVLSDYELLINKINENPEGFEYVSILPQLHTLVWGNKQGV